MKRASWSRSLFVVAGSLLLFSLGSCVMSIVPNALQPNLPVNGSIWKTIGLACFVLCLVASLGAILATMFEQVERRSLERMRRELDEDLARLSRNNRRK